MKVFVLSCRHLHKVKHQILFLCTDIFCLPFEKKKKKKIPVFVLSFKKKSDHFLMNPDRHLQTRGDVCRHRHVTLGTC